MWIVVFVLPKGSGIHRNGFRMFPEMFGHENTLSGPKGKAHEVFGKRKRRVCGVQGPDARSRRQEPWRLVLESEKDSCLSSETDFV